MRGVAFPERIDGYWICNLRIDVGASEQREEDDGRGRNPHTPVRPGRDAPVRPKGGRDMG